MKQNLKTLIFLLVFIAACFAIPAWMPEWMWRGNVLFLILLVFIIISNTAYKNESK